MLGKPPSDEGLSVMEDILRALFDYQKFVGNGRLAEIISASENRYFSALSDDELEAVSAAGEPLPPFREDDPDD